MKEKKYFGKGLTNRQRRVTMFGRQLPNTVLLTLMVILNSFNGILDTWMDKGLADLTTSDDFVKTYKTVALSYAILLIVGWLNDRTCKLGNRKMLDESYTKCIKKLTNSGIASVSQLTTGGADNIIQSIARAEREIRKTLIDVVPTIVPFITVSYLEYKTAGYVSIVLNIVSILLVIGIYTLLGHMQFMQDMHMAENRMRSVTRDCIGNSMTVKFFHKEEWSIDRQLQTQEDVFADVVCAKKTNWHMPIRICGYLPTFINLYLCRENLGTVAVILVMGNTIWNAINHIDVLMDSITEKKVQTDILVSTLQEDRKIEKPVLESVKVDHAVVSYGGGRKFYLDGMNLPKGTRWALVGKSGTGKSTIAKAICGMYKVEEGYIPEYSNLYMFAEGQMFNTSIYENISLGDSSVTKDEVNAILNRLDLETDFDLDESVGENGSRLSTGMKQRVNLARVVVYIRRHQDDLIVLDECTSQLDPETSLKVIKFLEEELDKSNCTLLYISNKTDYIDSGLTDHVLTAYRDSDGNTRLK